MIKKQSDWIPLTQWSKNFDYPAQGTMRNLVAERKKNGAEHFLSMINGRWYVSCTKLNEWINNQKDYKTTYAPNQRRKNERAS